MLTNYFERMKAMKTRILQTALFLIICTFMTLCNFRVSAAEHEGLSGTQSIGLTEEEKNKQIYSPIEEIGRASCRDRV